MRIMMSGMLVVVMWTKFGEVKAICIADEFWDNG